MLVPWRKNFLNSVLAVGLIAGAGGVGAAAELTAAERTELEQLLAQLNFDPGSVDGEIDGDTRAAIRGYQEFAALEPSGEATTALLRELRQVASVFAEIATDAQPGPGDARAEVAVPDAATAQTVPAPGVNREPDPADGVQPDSQPAQPQSAESQVLQSQADVPQDPDPETVATWPAEAQSPQPAPQIVATGEIARDATMPEKPTPKVAQVANVAPESDPMPEPEAAPEADQPGNTKLAEPVTPEISQAPEVGSETGSAGGEVPATKALQDTPETVAMAPAKPAEAARAPQSGQESAAPPAPATALATPQKTPAEFDLGGVIARLKTVPTMNSQPERAALAQSRGAVAMQAALPGTVDGYRAFREAYRTTGIGDHDRAIDLYTQAIESGDLSVEDLASAFYNRANAYQYRGALEYAIADYDRAIVNNPELPAAYYNRGFAYRAIGEETRAVADFKAARARGWERLGARASDLPPPRP